MVRLSHHELTQFGCPEGTFGFSVYIVTVIPPIASVVGSETVLQGRSQHTQDSPVSAGAHERTPAHLAALGCSRLLSAIGDYVKHYSSIPGKAG